MAYFVEIRSRPGNGTRCLHGIQIPVKFGVTVFGVTVAHVEGNFVIIALGTIRPIIFNTRIIGKRLKPKAAADNQRVGEHIAVRHAKHDIRIIAFELADP